MRQKVHLCAHCALFFLTDPTWESKYGCDHGSFTLCGERLSIDTPLIDAPESGVRIAAAKNVTRSSFDWAVKLHNGEGCESCLLNFDEASAAPHVLASICDQYDDTVRDERRREADDVEWVEVLRGALDTLARFFRS